MLAELLSLAEIRDIIVSERMKVYEAVVLQIKWCSGCYIKWCYYCLKSNHLSDYFHLIKRIIWVSKILPSNYLREDLNQYCPKLRRASAIVTASVTETKLDSFSVFQKVSVQPARLHPTSMEGIHIYSPTEDIPRIEWKDEPRPLINSSQKEPS